MANGITLTQHRHGLFAIGHRFPLLVFCVAPFNQHLRWMQSGCACLLEIRLGDVVTNLVYLSDVVYPETMLTTNANRCDHVAVSR